MLDVGPQINLGCLTPPRLSILSRSSRDVGNDTGLFDRYSEIKFRGCIHARYLRLFEQRRL
jgi:hypothetical protein